MIREHSTEAVAAQIQVRERLKLTELVAHGYHFCQSCQKVTEKIGPDEDKCCWCGSFRVIWCPGIGETQIAVNE